MSFLDNIVRNIHSSQGVALVPQVRDLEAYEEKPSIFGWSNPDPNSSNFLGIYETVSTVNRSVEVKSQKVAELPILIEQKQGDDWMDITDHRDFEVLRTYNKLQTGFDFWESTIGYLETLGEVFWILNRNNAGSITDMYPVPPPYVQIHASNEFKVDHYEFTKDGKTLKIEPEDMFMLKYWNPTDPLRGLSPMNAAMNDIILDLYAQTSSKRTFEKGATPSGILSTKEEMGEGEWNRMQKYVKDQHTGADKYGKIMFLTGGLTWQQMSMDNTEMQFMDQRKFTQAKIREIYGVPPIFFMDFSDASVLANADIQFKMLWDTIKPTLIKIQLLMTEFLLPQISQQPNIRFRFDMSDVAALQPDLNAKIERYGKGFDKGAISPNEIRVGVFNLAPDPNPAMDMRYINQSLIPIESSGIAEPATPQKALKDRLNVMDVTLKSLIPISRISADDLLERKYQADLKVWKATGEAFIERALTGVAKKFDKELKVLLDKQAREVVSNAQKNKQYGLRRGLELMGFQIIPDPTDKHKYSTEGVNFDFSAWAKTFEEEGQPYIAQAMTDAGVALAKQLDEVFNAEDVRAIKFVGTRSHEYAAMVNETTKEAVNKIVAQGIADNLTVAELAVKLEQHFVNNNAMRATRIARTEVVGATNSGRSIAMNQIERVTEKMWVSQRDGDVRDLHTILDGTVIKVDGSYPGYTDGYSSQFPSSIAERCYEIPFKVKKPK